MNNIQIDTSSEQVDDAVVDKLMNPSPMIRRFEQTPEKMKVLARHLMENKYSLSDEYRDYDIIYGILNKYLSSELCIFYEIVDKNGEMAGIFGFTDIILNWKCHAIFELLKPEIWGKQLVRESRALFDLIMDTGKLIKISSQTADKRVRRMAEMIGFSVEGKRQLEFSWTDAKGNRRPYDIYLIGRTRIRGEE